MNNKKYLKKLLPIIIILLLLLLWQICEDRINATRAINRQTSLEFFLPSPRNILNSFIRDFNLIGTSIINTLFKSFVGFIIGAAMAIIVAILFTLLPTLRKATLPIAYTLNSFPIMGLAPIIVLAFGQGTFLSIVIVVALVSYFPMLITLDGALNNIEQPKLDLMKIYKASKLQTLIYLRIPSSLPSFFVSLRLAIPASIIGGIIGEWMGAGTGIGRLMILSIYQMESGRLYACMLIVAFICSFLATIIELIGKKILFWNHSN